MNSHQKNANHFDGSVNENKNMRSVSKASASSGGYLVPHRESDEDADFKLLIKVIQKWKKYIVMKKRYKVDKQIEVKQRIKAIHYW